MARKQTAASKGSSRKAMRNSVKCSNYKLMSVRVTNKKRKLNQHLLTNKNDLDAKKSLKSL